MTSMASVQIFFLGFGFDACGQCTFDIAIFLDMRVYSWFLRFFSIEKKTKGKNGNKSNEESKRSRENRCDVM